MASAGAITCVSLLVGTWRSQRLCLPFSSNTLRRYFASGEMAAAIVFPLFVT